MANEHPRTRCEFCGAGFPNEDLLRDHREGGHGNRCRQCGADFTTSALLTNHVEGHHGGRDIAVLSSEQGELKP